MKVVITHYSDVTGLTASLIILQLQTVLPEEIIIIDTSPNKTGLEVASRYNYNLIPIKVICRQVNINKAWNIGIKEAKKTDLLILNDDLVMPIDLIEKIQFCFCKSNAYCVVPRTVDRTFSSKVIEMKYSSISNKKTTINRVEWMSGFCFALNKDCVKDIGLIDENFLVWFGDTDYERRIIEAARKNKRLGIVRENNTFVYHFGGRSYKYQNSNIQNKIDKDRSYFLKKYSDGLLKKGFKVSKMLLLNWKSKKTLKDNFKTTLIVK